MMVNNSTYVNISTKLTTTSHFKSLNTNKIVRHMTFEIRALA